MENQLLDFMRTIQVIYALALIVFTVASQIIISRFTIRAQRKQKSLEIYLEHKIRAYESYISSLLKFCSIVRKNVPNAGAIEWPKDIMNDLIFGEMLSSQSNALMFASKKLTTLIEKCDTQVQAAENAKDVDELDGVGEDLYCAINEVVIQIQTELRSLIK